jgi:gliding motility-associated-like protein
MNKRVYILFLGLITVLSTAYVSAQYADVVCAGDARVYKTTGNAGSSFQWTLDGGGTITGYYNDSIEVVWGNVAGNYHLQVVQTSKYGCNGAPLTATVKVSAPPTVDLGNDVTICSGKTTMLDAGAGFALYQWSNGSSERQQAVDKPGKYKVIATDANGCIMSDSVNVAVAPSPKVYLGRDTSLCEGELLRLDAGPNTDTLQYLWSDGTTYYYKIASATDFPRVSVIVTNLSGCSGSDSIAILPCDIRKYFDHIQNTITPNGDGKNDTWVVSLLDLYPNAQVQIYDRWGQIVFQSNHGLPSGGWDGTWNGRPLPMDSYYYIIDLKVNGAKFTGTITIVR